MGDRHWSLHIRQDYYAGALMVIIGLVTATEGRNYPLGTLQKMGPGYFPVVLGVLLIVLGALIAGTASVGRAAAEHETLPRNEWRGWACIIAGPALFIVLGKFAGLIPATFACVFVSALGDRSMTLKGAVVLSVCVAAFGVVVFSYFLQIAMPVLTWGWP